MKTRWSDQGEGSTGAGVNGRDRRRTERPRIVGRTRRRRDARRAPIVWHAALGALLLLAACAVTAGAQTQARERAPREDSTARAERRPQPRPHGQRVAVDPAHVRVDDGDTVDIDWGGKDHEIIRVLGIDTPETAHPAHDLPYEQAFGDEARGFASGAFAAARKVELLRSDTLDPYGRTLGYLFVNGVNYSVLVVRARLAAETVSHYGDNGFPKEAAEVLAAAKAAGPVPFEAPYLFRQRMHDVSRWMKDTGRRE
jgi:endonuclease YncB( thermonuclease family)